MIRRSGKNKKRTSRSNISRFEIDRLEVRQLLAGFATIPSPGSVAEPPIVNESPLINVRVSNFDFGDGAGYSVSDSGNGSGSIPSEAGASGPTLNVGNGFVFVAAGTINYSEPTTPEPSTPEPTTPAPTTPEPTTPEPTTTTTSEPLIAYPTPNRSTAPDPVATIIGPVAEARPSEPSTVEPEKGVYYVGPVQESQLPNTANLTTVQARAGLLAQTQLFALVSPADIPVQQTPAASESAVATDTTSDSQAPTASSHVDRAFETFNLADPYEQAAQDLNQPVTNSDPIPIPVIDLTELELETSEEAVETINTTSPTASPDFEQLLSSPSFGVFPALPLNILGTVLRAETIDDVADSKEAQPATTPVNPDLHDVKQELKDDKPESDEQLARGVQLFEAAVLILGLPSSRIYRPEDKTDGKPSV